MYPIVLLRTIFTLFTTLWCCIRPDLPSQHDSKLRIFSTKLNIVVWALICPEAILYWAIRQWFEAGKVAKEFQNHGWTRRHGLFFLMGGFILCNRDGKPIKTLALGPFTRLLNQKLIDFPTLTTSEIQECSNFHAAIGLIALLQALWFMMHCLSHFINLAGSHLPPITQLEAITASIELSCVCIMFFAWKKPLDARSSIPIKPLVNQPTHLGGIWRTVDQGFQSIQISQRRFQLECPHTRSTSVSGFLTRLRPTTKLLVSILLWPFKTVFRDMFGLSPRDVPDFPDGTLKLPLFFVQSTMHQRVFLIPPAFLSVGISIISLLFVVPYDNSTLHHFPSAIAQLLWLIASTTAVSFSASLLCFSILSSCFYFLTEICYRNNCIGMARILSTLSEWCLLIVIILLLIGLAPFLLARFVLLVTSIVCLGSTSGETLLDWTWADYIPHFL